MFGVYKIEIQKSSIEAFLLDSLSQREEILKEENKLNRESNGGLIQIQFNKKIKCF
jgi:hypothetical protein